MAEKWIERGLVLNGLPLGVAGNYGVKAAVSSARSCSFRCHFRQVLSFILVNFLFALALPFGA